MEYHHHIVGIFIDEIPTIVSYATIKEAVYVRRSKYAGLYKVFPDQPLLRGSDLLAPDYFYSFKFCPKCGYEIPWSLLLEYVSDNTKIKSTDIEARRAGQEGPNVFVDPDDPCLDSHPNPYKRNKTKT